MSNTVYDKVLEMRGKGDEFINPKLSIVYEQKVDNVVEAATLLKKHMSDNNLILVYGDYDCDLIK